MIGGGRQWLCRIYISGFCFCYLSHSGRGNREAEMAASCITMTIIIITSGLSVILGFEVTQPVSQTVNQDGSASIRCEHTENDSFIEDVRLNRLSVAERSNVCQRGMTKCQNIIWYQENPNSFIFILLNTEDKDMTFTYECEFTAKKDGLFDLRRGTPTRLLPGPEKPEEKPVLHCPSLPLPPSPPPLLQLRWILIGLLALMFLYGSVITSIYIRLRVIHSQELYDSLTYVQMQRRRGNPEFNSTYMEMRKAPLGGRGSPALNNPSG